MSENITAAFGTSGDKRGRGRTRLRPTAAGTGTGALWRRWLGRSAVAGAVAGMVWWMAAPSGAFYGDGNDAAAWFPRDAVLGLLLALAGAAAAVLALRGQRGPSLNSDDAAVPVGFLLATVAVGGLLGSVIAWRMGVFAGDLFQRPPSPMANPSMVFSLRSAVVLLFWPLASALVVFSRSIYSYAVLPAAVVPETVDLEADSNR